MKVLTIRNILELKLYYYLFPILNYVQIKYDSNTMLQLSLNDIVSK